MCGDVQESDGIQEQLQGWVSATEEKEGKRSRLSTARRPCLKWTSLGRLSSGTNWVSSDLTEVARCRPQTKNSKDGRHEQENTERPGQHSGDAVVGCDRIGSRLGALACV